MRKHFILLGIVLILLSSFVSATIVENDARTVLYHSFDDDEYSAPTYSDLTPSGYDATNNGATTGGAGIYKESVSTDGISDYLTINGAITELKTNNEGTVCSWVNSAVGGYFLTFSNFASGSHLGLIVTADYLQFESNGGCSPTGRLLGDTDISDGTWHHFCFSSDGSLTSLVTDGVNNTITVSTGTNSGYWFNDLSCSPDRLSIGSLQRNAGPVYSAFEFDELAIFNRSLSLTEMQQLYNSGAPTSDEQYPFGVVAVNRFSLTAKANRTSASIINFTATLYNSSWNSEVTTTNGTANFNIGFGNYSLNLSGSGYAFYQTNFTDINNSESRTAYMQENNSIMINIYNQNSGDLINESLVDVTFTNVYGANEYPTTNGTLYLSQLVGGNYTIGFESENYTDNSYSVYVADNTYQSLDAYLLHIDDSGTTIFYLVNVNTGDVIEGGTITVERIIGGVWTIVDILTSDITGRAQLDYEEDTLYRFTVTASGFESKTFTLNPVLFTSYTIKLLADIVGVSDMDYSNINIMYSPNFFQNNYNHTLSFSFTDPSGSFDYYRYNVTYKTVNSFDSGNNAYGEIFTDYLMVANASWGDVVILEYYYKTISGTEKGFRYTYTIGNSSVSDLTMMSNINKTYGLGLFERALVTILCIILVFGAIALFGNVLLAGGMALLLFGYFVLIGFIPIWSALISMLLLFIIIAWRSSQ